ncbi:MAG: hypothetical protein PF450_07665 [Bacteroidales bacterium]|jgi:membrane-associated phospholipid phosphatase|nr:hypothetical protein [Bacteroidales bacterium]
MLKLFAKLFSFLFHPLIMTSIGMLILFNSGTSLSVIQPEVKRIALVVTLLFTLVFPASMILVLYLTRVISDIGLHSQKERVLPMALAIVMYMFTFFMVRGIAQLAGGHIVYLFCPPVALFLALILNNFMKPSIHMLGIGTVIGTMLAIIFLYGAQIQGMFILLVIAAGILGTSRLVLKANTPKEVFLGFSAGFLVSLSIMTIYIL